MTALLQGWLLGLVGVGLMVCAVYQVWMLGLELFVGYPCPLCGRRAHLASHYETEHSDVQPQLYVQALLDRQGPVRRVTLETVLRCFGWTRGAP